MQSQDRYAYSRFRNCNLEFTQLPNLHRQDTCSTSTNDTLDEGPEKGTSDLVVETHHMSVVAFHVPGPLTAIRAVHEEMSPRPLASAHGQH